jgi:hypothetical protein
MATRSSMTSGHDPAALLVIIALSVAGGMVLLLLGG